MSARESPPRLAAVKRLESESAAFIALLVTATIWGTTPVATKSALKSYPPFILTVTRWTVAAVVLVVIMRRLGVRPLLDRRTAVLGVLGVFGFNTFFTFGLERTTAANGALLGGALPVVIAIVSYLVLGERLSPLRAGGIVLSMLGVMVTVLGATLNASVLGNVLVFLAVCCWSVYTIYNRERLRGENTMSIIAGSAVFGILLMIPLAAVEWVQETPPVPDAGVVAVILYLSLAPALGANYLWVFALKRVSASLAGVFSNLSPIVGIMFAGMILDEPITRYHAIGSVLVICGVLLTTWRPRPASG